MPEPIRFKCRCGRTVVTAPGTAADELRCCTRCRLRALRTDSDLTRRDRLAEYHARPRAG